MSELTSLMAAFPTGIAIVTAHGDDGQPCGMTCTSVAAVALDPACLLVCLRTASPTLAAVRHRSGFTLNLLHVDAQEAAQVFASGAPDRFDRHAWQADPIAPGPHLHEAAHTTADCRLYAETEVGDHTVVFGEVIRVVERAEPRPLLYGLRSYAAWPSLDAVSSR